MAIQQKTLEITIMTRASEPLEIDNYTLRLIEAAVDKAIRENVDLRYYPESRYVETRHDYLGVSLSQKEA